MQVRYMVVALVQEVKTSLVQWEICGVANTYQEAQQLVASLHNCVDGNGKPTRCFIVSILKVEDVTNLGVTKSGQLLKD